MPARRHGKHVMMGLSTLAGFAAAGPGAQSYYSSSLQPQKLVYQVNASDPSAISDGYIFVNPAWIASEPNPAFQSGPCIYKQDGELVWGGAEQGFILNGQFEMQEYNNEPVLVVFNGTSTGQGITSGFYFILNQNYEIIANISGGMDGFHADQHEGRITADGTILTTTYYPVLANQTYGNLSSVWVWNSAAQEIDIASGKKVFEWNPVDHVNISESLNPLAGAGLNSSVPWDFFHMNAIEKDSKGNLLISSRHYSTLFYVNGTTGEIIWRMGGNHSDFTIGEGANFEYQHHARFRDNNTLTIFDNGAIAPVATYPARIEPFSRGLHLSIDYVNMTVSLLQAYLPYNRNSTFAEGSVQPMPNGNIFMDFGALAYLNEFTSNGTLLYSIEFGDISPVTGQGPSSYRGFKNATWRGYPKTNPSATLNATTSTVYVSWNGATEVEEWQLSGSVDNTTFTSVSNATAAGFETALSATGNYTVYKVAGVSSNGTTLGSATLQV